MAKRIGLLTLPLNANFGGIIQAVSLAHALRSQGHQVVLLDRRRPISTWHKIAMPILSAIPFQNIRGFRSMERARRFHKSFINSHFDARSPVLRSSADMAKATAAERLDAVIVGSDQVWRLSYLHSKAVCDFFLGFVPDGGPRRISYAASFGVGLWQYGDRTTEVKTLLANFDALSVRENTGAAICKEWFGRDDAVHVLDPTLLIDPSFHFALADSATAPPNVNGKRSALFYMLDNQAIRLAALAALGPEYLENSVKLGDSADMSVADWLRNFKDADFVITDSYHGTIFAIVFRKPFVSIVNHSRGADRFTSLLGSLGLADRLVSDESADRLGDLIAAPIDYEKVDIALRQRREESAKFLTDALA